MRNDPPPREFNVSRPIRFDTEAPRFDTFRRNPLPRPTLRRKVKPIR